MKLTVLISLLFFGMTGYSVSRVGGGRVMSTTSNFEMKVPEDFQDMQQIENLVVAKGPLIFFQGGIIEQTLHIRDYLDYFSRLAGASREETIADFEKNGWSRKEFNAYPCVEVFTHENSSAIGWVATWGSGRGVTVSAPRTGLAAKALEQTLQDLKLFDGACAWE